MMILMTDIVGVLLPVLFVVIGAVVAVMGFGIHRRVRYRQRHWVPVPGEAYDYVWESSGNDGSVQYWMIRWVGADGRQHTARNPYGVSGGTLRTFPFPVRLVVNPDDPTEAQVAEGWHSGRLGSVLMIVVGLLFVIVGGLIGILSRT